MILVTGATGSVGREVVKQLRGGGHAFRALVRGQEGAAKLGLSPAETALGDFTDAASLANAMKGVAAVYLSCRGGPDQPALEGAVALAARGAGAGRIVKLSAMAASDMSSTHAKRMNGMAERRVMEAGVPYTMLRPTNFMQNFIYYNVAGLAKSRTLRHAVGDARIAFIDTRDIAAIAVLALTEGGHEGRAYDLSGPEALSYHDVAAKLSKATGLEFRYEPISDAELVHSLVAAGSSPAAARGSLSLQQHYREVGSGAVNAWTEVITGKPARTLDAFFSEHAALFKA
ncbi:MAG: NmrA family NAD(P)-binding protein [Alphaproteobacteria bacterium]|nr:NmrA family NAD(P)-binding protein [Alphaproteobacteria bacterium]